MSISSVDICNLALSGLGDAGGISSIDPPDNSAQAQYCSRFYPIALSMLLDSHQWGFATARINLAAVTSDTMEWSNCFVLPSDYINVIALLSGGLIALDAYSVELHSSGVIVIYCNEPIVSLVYTTNAALNPAKYPPLFIEALSLTLQYYLAGSIIKGDTGVSAKNAIFKQMQISTAIARASDAQNYKTQRKYISTAAIAHQLGSGTLTAQGLNNVFPKSFTVL